MIIRYLTPNDVAEHDKVTSQAFSYSCDITDPASVLPCEKVLGAFDDDDKTLLADFEINERKCHYDGGFLTCAAVGGVAAKPEHRGKGAVRALFDHLFRENAYDISILYPFAEGYYRRLGYERVGRCVSVTVPFADLAGVPRRNDAVLYEGHGTEQLLALYNRCAENCQLSFVREDAAAFSARPYLSQTFTYLWQNRSFATFTVDREKSTVFVREVWFDSPEALLGILGFLRNYESNQRTLCFDKLPEDSPLFCLLPDLKHCEIGLHNTGSARVLNVERVLRAQRYPAGSGASTLQIDDKTYAVTWSETGVTVETNAAGTPDVGLDIAAASQILLSGLRHAAYQPKLVIHRPGSDFFRAFPPQTAFFTDGF